MEPIMCRSPQQVSEDKVLDALIQTISYRKESLALRKKSFDKSAFKGTEADYQRWEDALNNLADSCEDTHAWRVRVNNTMRSWAFSMSRLD